LFLGRTRTEVGRFAKLDRMFTGEIQAEFGLRSRFFETGGGRRDRRGRISERVQVQLVVALATRLAFWIGGTRGRQIREINGQLYREIASDPIATQVGSVLGLARRELLGRSFDVDHYYSYVPEHAPGERLGLIVFLHGNGGNLQILPWAWRPFAERERFAIIAPTFGFGFWGKGGVAAVERALGDARDRLPTDPGRVYLAGISDGGKGVTRSAVVHPTRYRGLIYLSPTMVLKELTASSFAVPWRDRPLFVAQGGRDWNVRPSSVDPAVERLRAAGCRVTYTVFPEEDHFLFFARREELFASIRRWMDAPDEKSDR
jgi:pimeloyl-ACP methyl ester carboxylesterase